MCVCVCVAMCAAEFALWPTKCFILNWYKIYTHSHRLWKLLKSFVLVNVCSLKISFFFFSFAKTSFGKHFTWIEDTHTHTFGVGPSLHFVIFLFSSLFLLSLHRHWTHAKQTQWRIIIFEPFYMQDRKNTLLTIMSWFFEHKLVSFPFSFGML